MHLLNWLKHYMDRVLNFLVLLTHQSTHRPTTIQRQYFRNAVGIKRPQQ
jgi:hypothetical protein